MLIPFTAFAAGFVHVLSGPDHLAAVAPLATEDGERGWLAGWTWGVGHAGGVICVAAVAVLLRDLLPPIEALSAWSERVVGGALIAIGIWALRRAVRLRSSAHEHGQHAHRHVRVTRGPQWLRRMGHTHASFVMGVLHGLAGSSHLFGVLPALALPSTLASFLYLGAFGLGTVAAMTAFAAAVGAAGARARSLATAHRAMLLVAGVLALAVGTMWLVAPPA